MIVVNKIFKFGKNSFFCKTTFLLYLSPKCKNKTEMKGNDNFISEMTDEINRKGVVVIDNVRRMPVYGEPYASPHYTISINHRGSVCTEYEGKLVTFEQHNIAIVYPNRTLNVRSSSDDYQATLVVVSERLYERLAILNINNSRFHYEQHPHFTLTPSQYADVMSLVEALRIVSRLSASLPDDFIFPQLHILLQVIDTFRIENDGLNASAKGHISSRLYEAIIKHYKEHRDVEFYANLFCLSPKYFSTSIKRETGHSANYWIQQHVIHISKTMLRTEHKMSLQEISEQLGFPDLATFSRYFKRATGISPSEYRKGNM